LIDERQEARRVVARGDLGNDAAKRAVRLILVGGRNREYPPRRIDYRG
jgi:hypothetical protein